MKYAFNYYFNTYSLGNRFLDFIVNKILDALQQEDLIPSFLPIISILEKTIFLSIFFINNV